MPHILEGQRVWIVGATTGTAAPQAAAQCLERDGAEVRLFEQVDALWQPLGERPPGAVLVDQQGLVEPGALEAYFERLRARPDQPCVAMVMTDDFSVEHRRRLFRAGADDFVAKPIVTAELRARLATQLARLSGAADATAGPAEPSAKLVRMQAAGDGPLSILVVDDEPMVQRLLRARFERKGWRVEQAVDGRQAQEASRSQRFDVIVLDLNLPFKNGFELLAELDARSEARGPRTIVLSAEKQQASVLRAFELGADDFVSKPLNPDILVARIERLVGSSVA
jgi:two-component system, OmpR family, response regulator VicR